MISQPVVSQPKHIVAGGVSYSNGQGVLPSVTNVSTVQPLMTVPSVNQTSPLAYTPIMPAQPTPSSPIMLPSLVQSSGPCSLASVVNVAVQPPVTGNSVIVNLIPSAGSGTVTQVAHTRTVFSTGELLTFLK